MTNLPFPPDARADELLAIRCQLGERAAFDTLIARFQLPLWRYARNLTGSDGAADDASQEVWLRVLRAIGRLRDGARLRSWLFGIAHRVLMDRLREQYAQPPIADSEPDEHAAAMLDDSIESDLAAMFDELGRMPLVEREVLTLFYLRELSLDEVAQVLAIPVGTVKSRLYRARKLLRHQLDLKGVQP